MFRRVLIGAVAALLIFVVPGTTASAAKPTVSTESSVTTFRLSASNGYEIGVSADSEGKFGVLHLEIGKRGQEAGYAVKGEVSGSRIDFDLGPLGSVHLEVRPTTGTARVRTRCGRGKSARVPRVELVGTFEFHGEEGFAEAAATTIIGKEVPYRDLLCFESEGEVFGEGLPGTFLTVRHEDGPDLWITQSRPGGAVAYEALLSERLADGVGVTRDVRGTAKASDFRFDDKLSSASFHPSGGALSGALTYKSTKLPKGAKEGVGKVDGNLVANFPGHQGVALGGPGFTATIVHGSRSSPAG
ncbi:MAG TPA: hypothetical protein VHS74_17490 [Solirubrobacterales bacterium]|jgi:hypothetical protein|nr:hypothetical protein [Solirubrobacterales bacterium]